MRVPGKQSLRIGGDCFAEDCDRRHDVSYSRVVNSETGQQTRGVLTPEMMTKIVQ